MTEPLRAGLAAHAAGRSTTACPYTAPADRVRRVLWIRGWVAFMVGEVPART